MSIVLHPTGPSVDRLLGECWGYGIAVRGLEGSWPGRPWSTVRADVSWKSAPGDLVGGDDPWWSDSDRSLRIGWSYEAEYRIALDPSPSVEATLGPVGHREAGLSFLVAVLPLVLPLFDLEPLHGAALGIPGGGAVLLLGPSGAGKSTTANALLTAGFDFLADDACAVDGAGLVWPGPPLLAAERRLNGTKFARYYGKTLAVPPAVRSEPVPVRSTVLLRPEQGADLGIQAVKDGAAFVGILGQVRSRRLLAERRRELQLTAVSTLASRPVFALRYDHRVHDPRRVAGTIIERVASPEGG